MRSLIASTLTLLTGVLPLTAAIAQQTDMQPPQPLASPTIKPAPNPMIQPVNRAVVNGTVTYLARIALPPNAVVKVSLQDVSRADVAAILLMSKTIATNGKQVAQREGDR
jgi:uncharacterized lipoprotein YbaY